MTRPYSSMPSIHEVAVTLIEALVIVMCVISLFWLAPRSC